MASIFINRHSLLLTMENTRLNTAFIVLLVVTSVLFTFYYILDSEAKPTMDLKVKEYFDKKTQILGPLSP